MIWKNCFKIRWNITQFWDREVFLSQQNLAERILFICMSIFNKFLFQIPFVFALFDLL